MSILQAIIASIAGAGAGGGPGGWLYPPIGNAYPVVGPSVTENAEPAVVGYYEVGSLNTPSLGLYRRTYEGTAFGNDFEQDAGFPGSYTLRENEADTFVGFGFGMDNATNFTMEWLGYFKPAQTGNFVFATQADDYFTMWIGETAVSGFDNTNSIMQVNNDPGNSLAYPMTADRYYPVRIRFAEYSGAHNCTIWSGLSGTTLAHNQQSAATGQFFYDINTANSAFPGSGLIT
jgi:hypothetical protein